MSRPLVAMAIAAALCGIAPSVVSAESTDSTESIESTEAPRPSDPSTTPDTVEIVETRRVNRASLARILQSSHEPPISGDGWRKLGVDVEDALIEVARDRSRIFGARIRALHALAELRGEAGRQVLVEFAESEGAPAELRAAAREALSKHPAR